MERIKLKQLVKEVKFEMSSIDIKRLELKKEMARLTMIMRVFKYNVSPEELERVREIYKQMKSMLDKYR